MTNSKKIVKSLLIVMMLIMVITLLAGCGKKKDENKAEEYEQPIKNLMEGIQNTNVDQYSSAFPDFIDYKVKQKDLDDMMRAYIQLYGQDIKISYEIKEKEDISSEKLAELKENIKIYYEHDCNVTKGYKVEVLKTIKGSSDQQVTTSMYNVYEIDGQWKTITF